LRSSPIENTILSKSGLEFLQILALNFYRFVEKWAIITSGQSSPGTLQSGHSTYDINN